MRARQKKQPDLCAAVKYYVVPFGIRLIVCVCVSVFFQKTYPVN